MSTMQGRRVESVGEVMHGEAGTYAPVFNENGELTVLWFRLPTNSLGRIPNKGHGEGGEPEWTITVEADGSVTVDPSIEQHAIENIRDPIPYWHGHLKSGVWTG